MSKGLWYIEYLFEISGKKRYQVSTNQKIETRSPQEIRSRTITITFGSHHIRTTELAFLNTFSIMVFTFGLPKYVNYTSTTLFLILTKIPLKKKIFNNHI